MRKALLLVLLLAVLCCISAFKASDFRTCDKSSFCRRHRVPTTEKLSRNDLSACKHRVVVENDALPTATTEQNPALSLKLVHTHTHRPLEASISLVHHVWRVTVDESPIDIPHPLLTQPEGWNEETDGKWESFALQQPLRARFRADKHVLVENLHFERLVISGPFGGEEESSKFIRISPHAATLRSKTSSYSSFEDISYLKLYLNPFRIDTVRGRPPPSSNNNNNNNHLNVEEEEKKRTIVSFNGNCRFRFESFRSKEHDFWAEEEPAVDGTELWEERWGRWTDSKPFGPSSVGADISFPPPFSHAFGLAERAMDFSLKPTRGGEGSTDQPYRLFNLDVNEYELNNPLGLYGSLPVLFVQGETVELSSHDNPDLGGGGSAAVLWLNPSDTFVDLSFEDNSVQSHFISETGLIDLFICPGPSPSHVMSQLSTLTGTHELPPLFSLGYHQCRWNYKNEVDLLDVHDNFDTHKIPVDVLWLDIEHTDSKKYFTWERLDFPDPLRTQKALSDKGRKLVTIVDPHIKQDDNYFVYREANEQRLFVSQADGVTPFEGDCWPGKSRWLDYLNPLASEFWSRLFLSTYSPQSSSSLFTWNDMNEPSVFSGPEISMPRDTRHHGGVEHREIHNMYGYLMTKATYNGHLLAFPNRRPFILSRSIFPGSQRHVAMWTGDNEASWSHLRIANDMLLSLSMSGFSFAGADVGGFFKDPEVELLVRWYQAAAFTPFFRGHAHIDTKRREPWLFGEENTSLIRNAVRTRYHLLPYLYTTFFQHTRTGSPVLRPIFFHFPESKANFHRSDAFLLGPAVLVFPVTEPGMYQMEVDLPGTERERWYEYPSGRQFAVGKHSVSLSMASIPVFVRGGHILPLKMRSRRSSQAMKNDPFTLVVHMGTQKSASGELYLDDGETFAYRTGAFAHRRFLFENDKLTCSAGTENGHHRTNERVESIVVKGVVMPPTDIRLHYRTTNPNSGVVDTSLPFSFENASQTLTIKIRTPNVFVCDDWSINFVGLRV